MYTYTETSSFLNPYTTTWEFKSTEINFYDVHLSVFSGKIYPSPTLNLNFKLNIDAMSYAN